MPLAISAMSITIKVTKHSVSEFTSPWTGNARFGNQHWSTTTPEYTLSGTDRWSKPHTSGNGMSSSEPEPRNQMHLDSPSPMLFSYFSMIKPHHRIAFYISIIENTTNSSLQFMSYSLSHLGKDYWSQIQRFQKRGWVAQPRSSAHSHG